MMSDDDITTMGARIDVLEERIAHQDDAIETLNVTITAQWKQIDGLNRQVAALNERLLEAETAAPPVAANEKPPHY